MFHKTYQTRNYNAKEKVKYMIWTNEMDSCFSKILVEHVKRGNQLDNTIMPATYAAALAVLNKKFGVEMTKDHLKNRLKTWRKHYAILKDILAQKGFKWDEAQKMVVADDAIWNDYVKSIKNYEELSIIFGNEQARVTSGIGAKVNSDLVSDEGMEKALLLDDKQAKKLRWTEEMDRYLGKVLVKEVRKGHKVENIIQAEAHNTAVAALNKKFGPDISKDHIKNRLRTWRKQYVVLKELLSHTGFKWNETQSQVIGNDSDWNDYIKMHPDAKSIRGRSIKNYNELRTIIDNEHGHGCGFTNGAKGDFSPPSNSEENIDDTLQNMFVDEERSVDNTGDGTENSSQRIKDRPSSSSHSEEPSRKRRYNDDVIEIMSELAVNIGRIADALIASRQSVRLDELFKMVQNISGFDDDLIIEACEFLSFDDKKAMMFMKLDERLRKLWLLKRLRGHSS